MHEPSEEYLFQKILGGIQKSSPVMYELGSYWCFYTMSFLKKFPSGISICVESGNSEMQIGVRNMSLNNLRAKFINSKVGLGEGFWSVDNDSPHNHIDILHSDIQGYEFEMLMGAETYIKNRMIDFIFISTHSQHLHIQCLDHILSRGYHLVSEVDFENTFCHDGIIVAQNPEMDEKLNFELPRLSDSEIISDIDFTRKFGN